MVQKYVSHTVLKKVHPYIFSRSLAIHLLENRVPIPHYRSKTWPFKYIYTTMKTYSFVRTEIQRKIVENALNEEAAQ